MPGRRVGGSRCGWQRVGRGAGAAEYAGLAELAAAVAGGAVVPAAWRCCAGPPGAVPGASAARASWRGRVLGLVQQWLAEERLGGRGWWW